MERVLGATPAPAQPRGHPRLPSLREIMNAVLYVLRTGCQWRLLPHEFPPWKTTYHYFRLWRLNGTWEAIHTTLREQLGAKMESPNDVIAE